MTRPGRFEIIAGLILGLLILFAVDRELACHGLPSIAWGFLREGD